MIFESRAATILGGQNQNSAWQGMRVFLTSICGKGPFSKSLSKTSNDSGTCILPASNTIILRSLILSQLKIEALLGI